MPGHGLDQCAKLVAKEGYPYPEKADEKSVRELLDLAYRGSRP